jgi:hypothetical protein
VQLGKGTLLPTIANKGGALALLFSFCLLLQLMVVLFLFFATNERVENEPKKIIVLFVFLLDANLKESKECWSISTSFSRSYRWHNRC